MVVSMDNFAQDLSKVTCDHHLALSFRSNEVYKHAASSWQWVNSAPNRSFIMVVNFPGCDEDEGRQPWVVNSASFTDANSTVNFIGDKISWLELANDISIEWGQSIPQALSEPWKRFSISKSTDHSFDITESFNPTFFESNYSGLDFAINCNGCGSKGNLELAGKVSTGKGRIGSAAMTVIPKDVEIDLGLQFVISGTLGSGWEKDWNLLSIPIQGFKILDVINVG